MARHFGNSTALTTLTVMLLLVTALHAHPVPECGGPDVKVPYCNAPPMESPQGGCLITCTFGWFDWYGPLDHKLIRTEILTLSRF